MALMVDISLASNPKIGRLAFNLEIDHRVALGQVLSLLLFCSAHAPDGDLSEVEDEQIEMAAGNGYGGCHGAWIEAAGLAGVLDGRCLAIRGWSVQGNDTINTTKSKR